MSKEFIKAAQNGDLKKIKQLISNVDINFTEKLEIYPSDFGSTYQVTALSAAVTNNHQEVVEFLLKNGAKVEGLDIENYSYDNFRTNAIFAYCFNENIKNRNLAIFKLLLEYAVNINPKFGLKSIFSFEQLFDLSDRSYIEKQCIGTDAKACLELLFHEALIRNEQKMLQGIIKLQSNIDITASLFQKYLENRKLTEKQVSSVMNSVDFLISIKHLWPNVKNDLKNLFEQDIISKLETLPEQTDARIKCLEQTVQAMNNKIDEQSKEIQEMKKLIGSLCKLQEIEENKNTQRFFSS
ncbi:ankyrin repeat domain-containing protein [Legionella gresilensis]|uniref:ankyrin repeat domain-containing protein n=1 Tax=Legionella gresilensis TaxID=91823 RepID=UPI0013EF8672|nr:ankyrin repeat domain-containing protein [Legionella gresilensis]